MTVKQIGYIVAAMLILATLKLPIGYYTFLRICVTGLSCYYCFEEYKASGKRFESLVILFAVIAILFNPFIIIHLKRDLWMIFNIVVAIIFAGYATQK